MPSQDTIRAEDLLRHPIIKEAVSDINQEVAERRQYVPPKCAAFKSPCTLLAESDAYCFEIDRHAREALPDIIDNKVQKIVADDAPTADRQEGYHRKRRIGIVFSGGPAPGGHNVIAGLFDAVHKANPDSEVYGFLLGPDGIIENRAVKLTAEQVNSFRNLGGFTMIKTGRTKIDTPPENGNGQKDLPGSRAGRHRDRGR